MFGANRLIFNATASNAYTINLWVAQENVFVDCVSFYPIFLFIWKIYVTTNAYVVPDGRLDQIYNWAFIPLTMATFPGSFFGVGECASFYPQFSLFQYCVFIID